MTPSAIPVTAFASGLLAAACAAPQPSPAPPAELHVAPIASAPPVATATTTVTMTAPGVDAGDTREGVFVPGADDVIMGLRPSFRRCYEDGLQHHPKMEGRVVVSVVVGERGTVDVATMESNTGLSEDVAACFIDKLRYARFTAPGAGKKASLRVPITFVIAQNDAGARSP